MARVTQIYSLIQSYNIFSIEMVAVVEIVFKIYVTHWITVREIKVNALNSLREFTQSKDPFSHSVEIH